uniref:14-3-3 domain-containing protein n=2 Tax=Trichobilharzia regenti TaxID=157069 RepID=A0AA85K781_TRIRE|nr:unnamed protein product [Trichobilharzia regenti]
MSNRDDMLFHAKVAEQAARYCDMVNDMEKIARLTKDFTEEERNLFSISHKQIAGPLRTAIKVISASFKKSEAEGSRFVDVDKLYLEEVEKELRNLSHRMIQLIESGLTRPESTSEQKIFFLKLKADYFRYLAEFEQGNDKSDAAECSLIAYKEAYELAVTHLQPTHPIRLGVALNFAIFYYEIVNSADRACKLAKQAFDDAIAELDNISEESFRDSSLVMQLLRDNLALWIADMQKHEKDPRA